MRQHLGIVFLALSLLSWSPAHANPCGTEFAGDPIPCADDGIVAGCTAVLAASPEGFVWSGLVSPLGTFDGTDITACLSAESFAGGNVIWCLLADAEPAAIDGGEACMAFRSLDRDGDRILLGVAHESAALDYATYLRWNGTGFDTFAEFESCKGTPPKQVPSAIAADFAALAAFCQYPD